MPDIFEVESQTMRDRRLSESDDTEAMPDVLSSNLDSTQPPNRPPVSPSPANTEKHSHHARIEFLSAFCENPENVSFQTQEEGERILLFLRKSKYSNLPWIILALLFAVLPIFLFFSSSLFPHLITTMQFTVVLIPFYYLILATYAFVNFILWYYNAAIITDKRIIDIDFHQLVIKDIAETKLTLVQDVSYRQIGVFQNIFGFGFVMIQTAGAMENFEFYNLPQPARVVEIIEPLIGGRRAYEP